MKTLAAAALLLLVLGALACSGRLRKDESAMSDGKPVMTDDALIGRVRGAVDSRVAPREIEAFVGKKAMVNTTTGFSLEGLRRVNVIPDPDHPEQTLKLDAAEAVVYFGRLIEANDPKIVGVQYRRDGSAALFFGIILPP